MPGSGRKPPFAAGPDRMAGSERLLPQYPPRLRGGGPPKAVEGAGVLKRRCARRLTCSPEM